MGQKKALLWEPSEGSHALPRWNSASKARRVSTRLAGMAALALGACGSDPLGGSGAPDRTVEQMFAQDVSRDVDFLFVVDNSDGMAEEQAAIGRAFPALMTALRQSPAGQPNLRVGVISSDLGAPGSRLAGCDRGDRGLLAPAPLPDGCKPQNGRFLISLDGGTRTNFSGDIAEAFACASALGTRGCGFEQPLAAARRALGADQPLENEGFLRAEALLALVILADEDDCSAPPHTDLFEPPSERYGPQASFRCAEWGHLCGGRPPPRTATAVAGPGAAAEDMGKLSPVAELVAFFKGLKNDPGRILVAAVAGPEMPYAVVAPAGEARLASSCPGQAGGATPAIRLKEFADAFGSRGMFASACDADLAPALARVGEAALRQVDQARTACLAAAPVRIGVDLSATPAERAPPACRVYERVGPFGREVPIALCNRSPVRPCWRLARSPDRCDGAGYELQIERSRPPAAGAVVISRCRVCSDPRDTRCP